MWSTRRNNVRSSAPDYVGPTAAGRWCLLLLAAAAGSREKMGCRWLVSTAKLEALNVSETRLPATLPAKSTICTTSKPFVSRFVSVLLFV